MVQDAQLLSMHCLDTAKALATAVEKIGFDLLILVKVPATFMPSRLALVGEILQLSVINAVSAIQRQATYTGD